MTAIDLDGALAYAKSRGCTCTDPWLLVRPEATGAGRIGVIHDPPGRRGTLCPASRPATDPTPPSRTEPPT